MKIFEVVENNRCTDQPMFILQKKVRDWGYSSGHEEGYKWVNSDDYEDEANEEKAAELEALDDACEGTGPWEKCYYRDRWEFVTACFTEQGCKDYIEADGHNHGELRIYAEGSFRNNGFRPQLLEVLSDGDLTLYRMSKKIVDDYCNQGEHDHANPTD